MGREPDRAPGARTAGRLPKRQLEHEAAPDTPSHLSGHKTQRFYLPLNWWHICEERDVLVIGALLSHRRNHLANTNSAALTLISYYPRYYLPLFLTATIYLSYHLRSIWTHLDLIGEIRYPQWQPTGYIKGSVMCNGPTTWPWSASPCRSRVHAGTCQNKHTSKCWFADKKLALMNLVYCRRFVLEYWGDVTVTLGMRFMLQIFFIQYNIA